MHQVEFSFEAAVVVVLTCLEIVFLMFGFVQARASPFDTVGGRVLAQLAEVGLLAEAGTVQWTEATVIPTDVCVTTCAVIAVHNRFGMNVCERFCRSLLLNHEFA